MATTAYSTTFHLGEFHHGTVVAQSVSEDLSFENRLEVFLTDDIIKLVVFPRMGRSVAQLLAFSSRRGSKARVNFCWGCDWCSAALARDRDSGALGLLGFTLPANTEQKGS